MQSFVEGRAVPVHTVVDSIFNGRVPVSFGQRIVVCDDIADRVAVLEASELAFSVSNTQNQIAGSFGGFHAVN